MATIVRHVGVMPTSSTNSILHSNQTGIRLAIPNLATPSSILLTKSVARYRAYTTSLAARIPSVKPSRYVVRKPLQTRQVRFGRKLRQWSYAELAIMEYDWLVPIDKPDNISDRQSVVWYEHRS